MSKSKSCFQRVLLFFCLSLAFCGCQTTSSSNIKAPQKPTLEAMPNYPEETTGWNTNTVLMVFPNAKNQVYLLQLETALRKALTQRGYCVIDKIGNADTDWLATSWRQQTKLVIITSSRSFSSPAYENQITSDFCMQVLVVDPPCTPFPFVQTPPQIRTFQVWSRAPFPAKSTWGEAYPVHSKLLAENLLRMPNFRAALEATKYSPSAPQPCVKTIPGNANQQPLIVDATTNTTTTGTLTAKTDDPKLSAQIIGSWGERIVSTVATKTGVQVTKTSTSETLARTIYRADGRFTRAIRVNNSDWKNSEGTWSLKQGKLYTQTVVTSGSQNLTVSCEYDVVCVNANQMSFRMTPEGYQRILKSTGNSASGRCWYEPENVLHTVVTVGDFSVESTSKLEPATRIP